MRPIYASNRLDPSGWYAYQEPPGTLVLWDGGVNDRDDFPEVSGLWQPITGQPIPKPKTWTRNLPKCPLYGKLEGDKFHVFDFPHVDYALNLTGRTTDNPVFYLESPNGGPLPFFLTVLNAEAVLESCEYANFVRCRILPTDKEAALNTARDMGVDTMLRHPQSFWTPRRSPFFASVRMPQAHQVRIREVLYDEEGFVDRVTAWEGPERLHSFYPMYDGDQYPDNKVFTPKAYFNLYISEGIVLGYDN